MKPDPPRRKDNLCVVCLKPIKEPKGTWARADALLDPFDSAECARAWHGCPLPSVRGEEEAA